MIADAENGRRERSVRNSAPVPLGRCDALLLHEDHRNLEIEYFCETCEIALCRGCFVDHVNHKIAKLDDVEGVAVLVRQRWGFHAQMLVNVEQATNTALEQLHKVRENREVTKERLTKFCTDRISSSNAQFDCELRRLQDMIDSINENKKATTTSILGLTAKLQSEFESSFNSTVESLTAYIRGASDLRNEILDRHVLLSQTASSCAPLLLLKSEITDFVSPRTSEKNVGSMIATVFDARMAKLPQMVHYRVEGLGLWPEVKLVLSPDDPNGISNVKQLLPSLPPLRFEYASWRESSTYESVISMSHLTLNRFATSELELRSFMPAHGQTLANVFEAILRSDDAKPLSLTLQNKGIWLEKHMASRSFMERCAHFAGKTRVVNEESDVDPTSRLFSSFPDCIFKRQPV